MDEELQYSWRMSNDCTIRADIGNLLGRPINRRGSKREGFSLVELAIVVIIILITAATSIPYMVTQIRTAHLRGAASDYAGLLELARTNAIRDNRYYSTYILAPSESGQASLAYVDMLPKSMTGASGNGGTSAASGDPIIAIASDVAQMSVGNAPNTSDLQSQLLSSAMIVTPTDASVLAPTFGPRGLPCTPFTITIGGTNSGSVCDSSGGPTAYWTFLKNTEAGIWEAVTITPAGRIAKWYYTGSAWVHL